MPRKSIKEMFNNKQKPPPDASTGQVGDTPSLSQVLSSFDHGNLDDLKPTSTDGNFDNETSRAREKRKESPVGMDDTIKNLYEGPERCSCCINWVEQFPDDARDHFEGSPEVQRHALLVRNKKSHSTEEPLQIHSIVIQSPLLKPVLQNVFEGYSGITAGLEKLVFLAPFAPFFYRLPRLKAATQGNYDEKTLTHVKLLFDVVSKELQPSIQAQKDLVAHGVITFEYLWTLFEPDTVIFSNTDGHDRLYQLKTSIQETMGLWRSWDYFKLSCNYIDSDGTEFGYGKSEISIHSFEGTKEITKLSAYPMKYCPNTKDLTAKLLKRGKVFESLLGYHFKNYKGLAIGQLPWVRFFTTQEKQQKPTAESNQITTLSKSTHDDPYSVSSPYKSMFDSDLEKKKERPNRPPTVPPLTNEQVLLCSHTVRGYSLTRKIWAEFEVDNISDISFHDIAFSSLVLPANYKQLILSFVEAQVSHEVHFDDTIEGKGQGFIILLHGVPGVGKTLTAEAVAEKMHAPLYSLSAGELGSYATSVEEKLSQIFEMVTRWNAVLLLDEADVFLEQRTDGIAHNMLVAVFLRMLEYYKGVLFLTTNRVETFDSAFKSRIDVTINYPALGKVGRKQVWQNLLQQGKGAGIDEKGLVELADTQLNGREIKNAIKTAKLLAAHEKKSLDIGHIRTVLEVTQQNMAASG